MCRSQAPLSLFLTTSAGFPSRADPKTFSVSWLTCSIQNFDHERRLLLYFNRGQRGEQVSRPGSWRPNGTPLQAAAVDHRHTERTGSTMHTSAKWPARFETDPSPTYSARGAEARDRPAVRFLSPLNQCGSGTDLYNSGGSPGPGDDP